MEAQARAGAGARALGPDLPRAGVREPVLREVRREPVALEAVRRERRPLVTLRALKAEVRLRRLKPFRRRVRDRLRHRAPRREQLPDQVLRLGVLALAEVRVPHVTTLVDEVLGRPVLV